MLDLIIHYGIEINIHQIKMGLIESHFFYT